MNKFKKGDRVMLVFATEKNEAREGALGTVLEDSFVPWVEFDDFINTNYVYEDSKKGFTTCIKEEQLKLLNKPDNERFIKVSIVDGELITETHGMTALEIAGVSVHLKVLGINGFINDRE